MVGWGPSASESSLRATILRPTDLRSRSTDPTRGLDIGTLAGDRLDTGTTMATNRVFAIKFSSVYPLYVQKAERKQRTKEEVDQVIRWLTGYDAAGLRKQIEKQNDLETFFAQAPAMHPNVSLIKGVVCGVRVEDIEDPLMQKIRWMDKLVDELAKGKAMEKILRQ